MEPEWFYKPIEGYNRRYIRVGEFRQIRWCVTHDQPPVFYDELAGAICHPDSQKCVIVDKWLEV